MQKYIWIIILCLVISGLAPTAEAMYTGMNLGGIRDWSSDHVFIDVFKKSRDWMTRNTDGSGSWDSRLVSKIPRDENGWPVQIPFTPGDGLPPQIVHTIVTVMEAGSYTCRYEGQGTFTINITGLSSPVKVESDSKGVKTLSLDVDLDDDGEGTIWLEILATQPGDYLRNFQIITPGYENLADTVTFHPQYKERLESFSVLRFMDWGRTNASEIIRWQDRTRPEHNTQARSTGVAMEYMVQLANELEKDIWLCIPHMADDDYVTQAARLIRNNLKYNLKIYLEYSNETWNTAYPFGSDGTGQTDWVQDEGQRLNLDASRWIAGHKYTAVRSAQIWRLFESKFYSTADRVIKVLGSQSANPDVGRVRLGALGDPELNPAGIHADALAIAPYFGGSVADHIVESNAVETISVEAILDAAKNDMQSGMEDAVSQHQALSDDSDIWLITYEGGQHLAGTLGNENNVTLTGKLIAANRHGQMYHTYMVYLDTLEKSGISLFNHFAYIGQPNKWGSWGSLEYLQQPIELAPKFQALTDWSYGSKPQNVAPHVHLPDIIEAKDEDNDGTETIELNGESARDMDGWIRRWKWRLDGKTISRSNKTSIALPVGSHLVSLTVTDYQRATGTDTVNVVVKPNGGSDGNFWWQDVDQIDTVEGLTVSPWDTGTGITPVDDGDVLIAGLLYNGAQLSTLAEAIESQQYFTVTITSEPGYELDLRGAGTTIRIRRFDNHGGHRYAVFSSINGFQAGDQIYDSPYFDSWSVQDIDLAFMLPFENYGSITESVEFRIYPYEAQYYQKKSGIAGVKLDGAVRLVAK